MKHTLLCLLLIAVLCLTSCQGAGSAPLATWISDCKATNYALMAATYPQMAQYPTYDPNETGSDDPTYQKWEEQWRAKRQNYTKDAEANRMFVQSAKYFLTQKDNKNKVYSPINLYFALCMLAEVTEGDTRAEILSALGSKDIESLRSAARAIWNDNYCDDGTLTTRFGNSFWLSDKLQYREGTLKRLAENFYASSFSGDMGDNNYTVALHDWINGETGGLLSEQAEALKFDADTVMALVSTLYYKAKWENEFSKEATKSGVFHAPGGDKTCDFMEGFMDGGYYSEQGFGAVYKSMKSGGGMWLILPEAGKTPEDLMAEGRVTKFLSAADHRNSGKYTGINLKLPKFDVVSDMDVAKQMKDMGITKVFAGGDFSPISGQAEEIQLGAARHAARVKVDEEGCEAAAFTALMLCGALPPQEQVDFVLDRPFIFAVTSDAGCVLFTGVVNQPN